MRWRQFDRSSKPLAALNLGKTKSGVPRSIPVHPALQAMLDEFRTAGWERIYGRAPTEDDFIVPTRKSRQGAAYLVVPCNHGKWVAKNAVVAARRPSAPLDR